MTEFISIKRFIFRERKYSLYLEICYFDHDIGSRNFPTNLLSIMNVLSKNREKKISN